MVGIAAEWPFLSQPGYTGPLVGTLGGADISWLVGWFTAAIAYLLLFAFTPGTARYGQQIATTAYIPATPAGPESGGPVS